jgi:uncharacterized membrane protein YdfJ with MMPL/SSD domain
MPARLAERIAKHPRRFLLAAAFFTLVAAAIGGPVSGLLTSGDDFTAADSDSSRAVRQIEQATGLDAAPAVILLLTTEEPVRSPAGMAEVGAVAEELGGIGGVEAVASVAGGRGGEPATGSDAIATGGDAGESDAAARLISDDGHGTYLAATLSAEAEADQVMAALEERFGEREDILLGGALVANQQMSEQISKDLGRAEMIVFPLLILLSLLFFRGARAAVMPLVVGIVTVLGTFLVLRLVNEFKELSIFCLNLVIGLGLGLAIDYTLFLLTRYREELEREGPGVAAVRNTMATAGRTVIFSAATVAIALATLIVFPLNFLQSMAIGGAAVAVVAALAACIISPAFFALWNVRLKARERGGAHDRWYRVATRVMRRPGLIATVTAALMLLLALPSLRAIWTPADISTVPESLSARTVGDRLERDFPRDESTPLLVTVEAGADEGGEVRALAQRIGELEGIAGVIPPRRLDDATWQIDAIAQGVGADPEARAAVERIRVLPVEMPVLVGGAAAAFIDQQEAIGARLPLAIALLACFTFAVLWLMTGSVVLPLKALLMNALTVGATLGILALVFQDGRLEGLLGYTSNGGIEPTDFLVTATIVFALSTDYGVFLLGRIKEAHEAGLDDREAVAVGLARTGSVVTAAAILLAVAIGAFVTSEVIFIKQIGLGAALGVLIDALVVRALLVPSLMALLGPWNWWSPAPLRRLHDRVGLEEAHTPPHNRSQISEA